MCHVDWFRISSPPCRQKEERKTCLRSRNISLPIQRNITKRILIKKLNQPIQQPDKAPQNAKENRAHQVPLRGFILSRNATSLSQKLNERHQQTTKGYRTKAGGDGSLERTPRSIFRHSLRRIGQEKPRAVNACYGYMNDILEHFGNPVPREGDEDDESNNSGF